MVRLRKNKEKRLVSILLLEDNEHLGHVGDVVKVKPGYARNFLLPSGAACPVSNHALRRIERMKEQAKEHRAQRAERLAELAVSLEGTSLMLEQRASDEGHLFGSVGASTLVEALAERGIKVEEKQIALDGPIKELGIFNVPIRLDADKTAEIRVWVVEPEA